MVVALYSHDNLSPDTPPFAARRPRTSSQTKKSEAPKCLAVRVGEISKETSNHPGVTHQPIELGRDQTPSLIRVRTIYMISGCIGDSTCAVKPHNRRRCNFAFCRKRLPDVPESAVAPRQKNHRVQLSTCERYHVQPRTGRRTGARETCEQQKTPAERVRLSARYIGPWGRLDAPLTAFRVALLAGTQQRYD